MNNKHILRSKFMIRVEEDEEYNGREKKKIFEKDGWFVEKYDVIDKYIRRDKDCKEIDDLCPAQYLKMFLTSHGKKVKKPCVENISDNEEQIQNEFPDGEGNVQNDILDIELKLNKFYASNQSLNELNRLNRVSLNNYPPVWEQNIESSLKIVALNCQSLKEKVIELQNDPTILFGDVLCLSETWQKTDIVHEELNVSGYELHLNSIGVGKGLATYTKPDKAIHILDIKKLQYQITKLRSPEIDIISVYRSQGAKNVDMVNDLKSVINNEKTTICVLLLTRPIV